MPGAVGIAMRLTVWAGSLTVLVVAVVGLGRPQFAALDLVDLRTRRVVLCAGMGRGDEFVLRFDHSVNKRAVYDTLRIDGDRLVIVGSRFDAFGAGMPESTTDDGVLRVRADGWLEWTTNRSMPEVVVRVGRVANHALIL